MNIPDVYNPPGISFNRSVQSGLAQRSEFHNQLILFVSLFVPFLVLLRSAGLIVIAQGLMALAVTAFWHIVFCQLRAQKPGLDWITTGLLFALLLPSGFAGWQLILGISFGVVVGEQLYGGRGFSFMHPVITGLGFLFYSFPDVESAVSNLPLSAAMLPGLMLLLIYRLIDWRTLLSLIVGALVVHVLVMQSLPVELPGSLLIAGVLFAALDPAVGTSTPSGRWLYGSLLGALIVLFDPFLQSLQAVVFAALLSSLSAPLIDWLIIRIKTSKHRADHG